MNSITKLTITIITALVVVVGVMIPVTSGLDDNIKSVDQNSPSRFFVSDNDLTLEVDYLGNGMYEINGQEFAGSSSTTIIGDDLYLYLYTSLYNIIDVENNIVFVSDTPGRILTVVNGDYTYSNNGTEYNGSLTHLLYPDEFGNYGAFGGTESSFSVDKGEEIYLISNLSGSALPKFALTVVDGVEIRSKALIDPISTTNTTMQEYTGTLNITINSALSEDGLSYKYDSITYTAGETTAGPLVYAPLKYHTIDTAAETVKTIIGILPIIILIGLLMVAGYAVMDSIRNKTGI